MLVFAEYDIQKSNMVSKSVIAALAKHGIMNEDVKVRDEIYATLFALYCIRLSEVSTEDFKECIEKAWKYLEGKGISTE